MNLPNKTDGIQKNEILKSIGSGENAEDEAEFQILEAILKMIPEVKVSIPIIDADTSIVTPKIEGELANGGTVTEVPTSLVLTYNCLKEVECSTVIIGRNNNRIEHTSGLFQRPKSDLRQEVWEGWLLQINSK
jgi:hypothetical protein